MIQLKEFTVESYSGRKNHGRILHWPKNHRQFVKENICYEVTFQFELNTQLSSRKLNYLQTVLPSGQFKHTELACFHFKRV